MHKFLSIVILLNCLISSTYSQGYEQELKKLNSYLIETSELYKNDSLWVNNYGELYRRDGYQKSCSAYCKIKYIDGGIVLSSKNEFRVSCKEGNRFINSGIYSNCGGGYITFKPKYGSADSIGTLFKDFINAYYGNYANYNTIISNALSVEDAIKNVNAHLASMNIEYSEVQLKDKYLSLYNKEGHYVSVPVDKLDNIYTVDGYGNGAKFIKWYVDCEKCFKSNQSINLPKGENFYISFFIPKNQLQEGAKLKILLDDLAVALGVINNSISNYNVKSYQPKTVKVNNDQPNQNQPASNPATKTSELLLKINTYLKDNTTKLKSIEIRDSKVIFNFRFGIRTENQTIGINDFASQVTIQNVDIFTISELRIVSNTQTALFLSSLTNSYSKYITVSNDSVKQQLEIKNLLIELQKLLKSIV